MTRKNLGHDVYRTWLAGSQDFGQNRTDGNVFFHGDTIYSYGRHFPMAHKLTGGGILLNSDRYSTTTARHQSDVRSVVGRSGSIEIPFSALRSAGIHPDSVVIVDTEPSRIIRGTRKEKVYAYTDPETWRGRYFTGRYEVHDTEMHLMGRSVFRVGRRWYLSGIDETARDLWSGYFLAQLPGPAKTVTQALEILKPRLVIRRQEYAFNNSLDDGVKRQGEWFFLDMPGLLTKNLVKAKVKESNGMWWGREKPGHYLRHKDKNRVMRHKATELRTLNGHTYVRGTIRHTGQEHKMLTLGKTWHLVMENREVRSFTGNGRVD